MQKAIRMIYLVAVLVLLATISMTKANAIEGIDGNSFHEILRHKRQDHCFHNCVAGAGTPVNCFSDGFLNAIDCGGIPIAACAAAIAANCGIIANIFIAACGVAADTAAANCAIIAGIADNCVANCGIGIGK